MEEENQIGSMNTGHKAEMETEKEKKRPLLLRGGRRYVRDKLQGKTFLIPSLITVAGTFCGFLAIVSAIKGNFEYATKCIGLAFLLDGLDGRVARSLNATSAFGREFDSLSDLVAFGVAPAVLVYCWAFSTNADEIGILASFVFVICGATRLARFNVATETDSGKSRSFCGLPIPGAAAAITAVVYCFPAPVTSQVAVAVLMGFMMLLAVLMVSTLPYLSIKHVKLAQNNPGTLLLLLSISIVLLWKFSQAMLVIISVGYALSGVFDYAWHFFAPKSWEKKQRLVARLSR